MMIDLKARAVEIGLPQVRLAELLGVTEGTVSRWLNRKKTIPTDYLWRMSRALKLPVEVLLPPEPKRRPVRRAA